MNCVPIVAGLEASTKPHDVYAHGRVRMDACTMTNLELVLGAEGTAEGSLLRRISFGCSRTRGGERCVDGSRRRFATWGRFARGRTRSGAAADRGSAVAEAVESATRGLRGAPDLERAVGRARAARNAGLAAV